MTKKEALRPGPARGLPSHDPFATLPPAPSASMRQAPSPYDRALNLAAVTWLGELPQEVAPLALARAFPRIVNRLSRFWDSPQMIDALLQELLLDKRGKRKGFPSEVLDELHALLRYHRTLHPTENSDRWDSVPYRRSVTE